MVFNGGEIALEQLLSQSMPKGGQEVLRKFAQIAAEQVFTQTVSEGGQEVMKETARNEVIRTSTITGTSAGGSLIDHFRITFGLFFKASLGAHPFI